eukprot:TRINITY_DN87463_c0_g1_i1.p1 TRINITY_DN87463_c0_g1~~TRINITY_DN87463_c0_g1_i1.p1  ORF type:complete len:458 (-),score=240.47 TRINITY_DN87463_c0_g1_i1:34-1284(-)
MTSPGIPNSLMIKFHVYNDDNDGQPAAAATTRGLGLRSSTTATSSTSSKLENYVSVYVHSDETDLQKVRVAKLRQVTGSRTRRLIAALGDGRDHAVRIQYFPRGTPISSMPSDAGLLNIYVDEMDHPAIQVSIDIGRVLRLDGGRAWVGFTANTGMDDEQQRRRNRVRRTRDLTGWEFHEAQAKSSNAWRNIRLAYEVQPPIDLVLLTDDFDRYNALFQFLFLVKRIQHKLQQSWPLQTAVRKMPLRDRARLHAAFLLRASMQFLVDNLQYYLHVDVVEVQFQALVDRISQSSDFVAVMSAHEDFVNSLTRLCFLHARPISRALDRIFILCFDFCHLIKQQGVNVDVDAIEQMRKEFDMQASILFTILSRKTGLFSSSHWSQLVLRLDYNRHLSNVAMNLGVSSTRASMSAASRRR